MTEEKADADDKPKPDIRSHKDRRTKERRKAKRGSTIRYEDTDGYVPKRIRRGRD